MPDPKGLDSSTEFDIVDEVDEVDISAALANMGEHIERVRAAIVHTPSFLEDADESSENSPAFVVDVMKAALRSFGTYAEGLHRRMPNGGQIALTRKANQATLVIIGNVTRADVDAFNAELRQTDANFLNSAELLGILSGLCTTWIAAHFAPPVVLRTLRESKPTILELGKNIQSSLY